MVRIKDVQPTLVRRFSRKSFHIVFSLIDSGVAYLISQRRTLFRVISVYWEINLMWVINWSSPVTQKTFHGSLLAWCCQWKKNKCPRKEITNKKKKQEKPKRISRERETTFEKTRTMTKTIETESTEPLTVTNTINKQFNKFMTPPCDLLTIHEMPKHLQFNPYVHKGKRRK